MSILYWSQKCHFRCLYLHLFHTQNMHCTYAMMYMEREREREYTFPYLRKAPSVGWLTILDPQLSSHSKGNNPWKANLKTKFRTWVLSKSKLRVRHQYHEISKPIMNVLLTIAYSESVLGGLRSHGILTIVSRDGQNLFECVFPAFFRFSLVFLNHWDSCELMFTQGIFS